jgi:NADH-quinone oxidoreductase subunit G
VFPVAPPVEKSGTFVNWEGRLRPFDTVLNTTAMADGRVLEALAAQLGVALGTGDVNAVRRELGALPPTGSARPSAPRVPPARPAAPGPGEAVLATWHQLIDLGSALDGDEVLTATARPPVARIGKALADELGVADGDLVTVGADRGTVTLPAAITDLPDRVVWLPTNSPGSTLRRTLAAAAGAVVRLSAGAPGPILASGGTHA